MAPPNQTNNFLAGQMKSLEEMQRTLQGFVPVIQQINQVAAGLGQTMAGVGQSVQGLTGQTGAAPGSLPAGVAPTAQAPLYSKSKQIQEIINVYSGNASLGGPDLPIPENVVREQEKTKHFETQLAATSKESPAYELRRRRLEFQRMEQENATRNAAFERVVANKILHMPSNASDEEVTKAIKSVTTKSDREAYRTVGGASKIQDILGRIPERGGIGTSAGDEDPHSGLRRSVFYSEEQRMEASQAVALGAGRHLGYDITEANRVSKIGQNVPEMMQQAAKAMSSEDVSQKNLGNQLNEVVKRLSTSQQEFTKQFQGVHEALAQKDILEKTGATGEQKDSAEKVLAERMEALRKTMLGLDDTEKEANRLRKSLPGGGSDDSGKKPFSLEEKIKTVAAVASFAGGLYTGWKTIEAATYQEGVGKERAYNENLIASKSLAETRQFESYDMTKPENLLKYRGDVLFPGRTTFLGETGRQRALEIAWQEESDRMNTSHSQYQRGVAGAVSKGAGGLAGVGIGATMGLTPGVGPLAVAVGVKMGMEGTGQMAGALTDYAQLRGTNTYSQMQGGLAGSLAGDLVWGKDARRRAELNQAAASSEIQTRVTQRVNELQNMEAQGRQTDLTMLREYQSFQRVQQEGAILVGAKATTREEMLNGLYGGRVSEADREFRPMPGFGGQLTLEKPSLFALAPPISRLSPEIGNKVGTLESMRKRREIARNVRDVSLQDIDDQDLPLFNIWDVGGVRQQQVANARQARGIFDKQTKLIKESGDAAIELGRQVPAVYAEQYNSDAIDYNKRLAQAFPGSKNTRKAADEFSGKTDQVKATASNVAAIDFAYAQEEAQRRADAMSPLIDPPKVRLPKGEITSGVGWRIHPITGERQYHSGVDIAMPVGTPLASPVRERGKVISVYNTKAGGNQMQIYYPTSDSTFTYGHLDRAILKTGDAVGVDQIVAYSGNTGGSTGPHVHASATQGPDRSLIDPVTLKARGTSVSVASTDTSRETLTRETIASRLGMSPSQFAAHRDMTSSVLLGRKSTFNETEEMVKMGRSGLGSFQALLGNVGAINQVGGGRENIETLKSVLASAVAAGFDTSRTAQQFVQTSAGVADALRLTRIDRVSGSLATTAMLTSATLGSADERGLRMAAEGTKGFQSQMSSQEGVVGAYRMMALLKAGANIRQQAILKDTTPMEAGEMMEMIEKGGSSSRLRALLGTMGGDAPEARKDATRMLKELKTAPLGILRGVYSGMTRGGNLEDDIKSLGKNANPNSRKFQEVFSNIQAAVMAGQGNLQEGAAAAASLFQDSGALSPAQAKEKMNQIIKSSQEIYNDPGQIKMSQFVGEVTRRGQGLMGLNTWDQINKVYGHALESGMGALTTKSGKIINQDLMDFAQGKHVSKEAMSRLKLEKGDTGGVGGTVSEEIKDVMKDKSGYDFAKMMQASASEDAQPVRIANTMQLAEDIVRMQQQRVDLPNTAHDKGDRGGGKANSATTGDGK